MTLNSKEKAANKRPAWIGTALKLFRKTVWDRKLADKDNKVEE